MQILKFCKIEKSNPSLYISIKICGPPNARDQNICDPPNARDAPLCYLQVQFMYRRHNMQRLEVIAPYSWGYGGPFNHQRVQGIALKALKIQSHKTLKKASKFCSQKIFVSTFTGNFSDKKLKITKILLNI